MHNTEHSQPACHCRNSPHHNILHHRLCWYRILRFWHCWCRNLWQARPRICSHLLDGSRIYWNAHILILVDKCLPKKAKKIGSTETCTYADYLGCLKNIPPFIDRRKKRSAADLDYDRIEMLTRLINETVRTFSRYFINQTSSLESNKFICLHIDSACLHNGKSLAVRQLELWLLALLLTSQYISGHCIWKSP